MIRGCCSGLRTIDFALQFCQESSVAIAANIWRTGSISATRYNTILLQLNRALHLFALLPIDISVESQLDVFYCGLHPRPKYILGNEIGNSNGGVVVRQYFIGLKHQECIPDSYIYRRGSQPSSASHDASASTFNSLS